MNLRIKTILYAIITIIILYSLLSVESTSFNPGNWKDEMTKLHFEAYTVFILVSSCFYYILKKYKYVSTI